MLFASSCSSGSTGDLEVPSGSPGDKAELVGVVQITMVEPTSGNGSLSRLSDTEIEYTFAIGPTCGPDRLAQQPGAVQVEYSETEIIVVIDPMTRNCSEESDADQRLTSIVIELEQPHGDREITVDAGDSDE